MALKINWLSSFFGSVGRGYALLIPFLLFTGYGLYLILFPEVASKRVVLRRGIENDPAAASSVYRRCRIIGGILLGAAFAALVTVAVSIWLGRLR